VQHGRRRLSFPAQNTKFSRSTTSQGSVIENCSITY
jgi:hypothetical protein